MPLRPGSGRLVPEFAFDTVAADRVHIAQL
jgi:hypothetical protein